MRTIRSSCSMGCCSSKSRSTVRTGRRCFSWPRRWSGHSERDGSCKPRVRSSSVIGLNQSRTSASFVARRGTMSMRIRDARRSSSRSRSLVCASPGDGRPRSMHVRGSGTTGSSTSPVACSRFIASRPDPGPRGGAGATRRSKRSALTPPSRRSQHRPRRSASPISCRRQGACLPPVNNGGSAPPDRGCTTSVVPQERQRLRELSSRLVRLHSLLLDRERRAYEDQHGPVGPRELLHLLINDEQFAWLRSLSTLMAQIDALVDAGEPVAVADAQLLLRETYRLLKSGDSGAFQNKYPDALQESPDVVMVHAGISELLRGEGEPRAATS